MLSLTIRNDKKVIYRGKGEGIVDIIVAIAGESLNDDFYMTVRRAVMLMEEKDLPDTKFMNELKGQCGMV